MDTSEETLDASIALDDGKIVADSDREQNPDGERTVDASGLRRGNARRYAIWMGEEAGAKILRDPHHLSRNGRGH